MGLAFRSWTGDRTGLDEGVEIIATSQGYASKASAKSGVASVQNNAADTEIVDLTA